MIERSMQADREKFAFEFSNVVPEEVMNQAFELLGVTRKQVEGLNTDEEERKA